MNKNNAGFLAVLGVIVAAAIGAFFVAPRYFGPGGETASQPEQSSSLVDSAATAPETPAGSSATGLVGESDTAAVTDSWVVPSFDVLRVEPDGSTVIAGKAEPGTTLNIMNGETIIASTRVGPSGDFAAVLDTPLAVGDYQLTLQIVGEDGAVRQSEEVATVSIPSDAGGDLLAMVSKPGKASRIIAQPAAPAAGQPASVTATDPAAEAAAPAADSAATAPEAQDPEAAEVAAVSQPADGTGPAEAGDAAPSGEMPALPEASSLLTTSAPDIDTATDPAARDTTAAPDTEPATEVAAASPETAAELAAPAVPADATVRVDAVEIEGDRVFIAGSATPGYQVRVSADGVVIGTDQVDASGRFIIEAVSELAVGDHIISADLIDSAGQEVLLRATVPFNRPEGDTLAAVAPEEPAAGGAAASAPAATEEAAAASAPDAPAAAAPEAEAQAPVAAVQGDVPAAAADGIVVPDIAGLSRLREEAFEALTALTDLMSSDAPDAAQLSAAYANAVAKLEAAATAELPAGSSSEAVAVGQSMRAQAQAALAAIAPQAARPGGGELLADLAGMRARLKQAETALSEPAEMAVAAANADQATAPAGASEPRTIVQAPLASTPGAVIIRRGDTLWQISRRTYGQGVRYTTIYVANRSQIEDPDRIMPGQVFSVPETPMENAEELHKELTRGGKKR